MSDDPPPITLRGRPAFTATWQLIISGVAVVIAVTGSIVALMVNINTLSNAAVNLSSRVLTLESRTIADQDREVGRTVQIAGMQRDLIAVETQFCAEEELRNLMHATDLRLLAVLWSKSMGTEIQIANTYYPRIAWCQVEMMK